jgi:hypothetical protein
MSINDCSRLHFTVNIQDESVSIRRRSWPESQRSEFLGFFFAYFFKPNFVIGKLYNSGRMCCSCAGEFGIVVTASSSRNCDEFSQQYTAFATAVSTNHLQSSECKTNPTAV